MDMVERIRLEKDDKDAMDEATPDVGKFKAVKWVSWKLGFQTQLAQVLSIMENLPISYIIRPSQQPDAATMAAMAEEDRRIWTVQFRGNRFKADNKKVFRKLKMTLLDTDGWTWIQSYDNTEDGRGAWLALVAHYDGPGETEKRISLAQKSLKLLHYRSESHAVNFEAYSTKMLDALTILKDNGVRYEPWQWVDFLLNGIDPHANQMVHTAKSIIRFDDNLKQDFSMAVNKLSEFITKETPAIGSATPRQPGGRRTIAAFRGRGWRGRGRGGRGGRGGRFGRGRGGRGGFDDIPNHDPNDTRTNIVGIDVTDPTRDYSDSEYTRLAEAGYTDTLKYRRRLQRSKSSSSATSISSLQTENSNLQRCLAALEGRLNAEASNQQDEEASTPTSQDSKKTRAANGNQFGSGAYKKQRQE